MNNRSKITNWLFAIALLGCLTASAHAIGHERVSSETPFTGDNVTMSKITVSSTTASTLGAYSGSRGALTCINSDSSNAVYIGSSTAVTAQGSFSFPLLAQSAMEFRNNAALFAIAPSGISSVVVYCTTEW